MNNPDLVVTQGTSMQPTLYALDILHVIVQCSIQVGDVVVFREGSQRIAHRIIARLPWPLHHFGLQRGDAQQFGKWLDLRRIEGVVVEPDIHENIPTLAQLTEIACHIVWHITAYLYRLFRQNHPPFRCGIFGFAKKYEHP